MGKAPGIVKLFLEPQAFSEIGACLSVCGRSVVADKGICLSCGQPEPSIGLTDIVTALSSAAVADKLTPYQSFRRWFRQATIAEAYEESVRLTSAKGVDRLDPTSFEKQMKEHFSIIRRKCLDGSYRFSPYLEILKSKGRGREPRVVSVPTVRDRVVFCLLKELLHEVFPECVNRMLPNAYVRAILQSLGGIDTRSLDVVRLDVKGFYDNLDHTVLERQLRKRIRSKRILALICKALETQTVPLGCGRRSARSRTALGVPQGLAISNILANIYMRDFDRIAQQTTRHYWRFVDDILVLVDSGEGAEKRSDLEGELRAIGLEVSEGKSSVVSLESGFEFLGYRLQLPLVSVRLPTVQRFIQGIAARFSAYSIGRETNLLRYPRRTEEMMRRAFVEDLNEKITGAIRGKRRYGWLFYFQEINDLKLLYRLDAIVASLFRRLDDFEHQCPSGLKRFVRTYYEARFNIRGGYILDYEGFRSTKDKLEYLVLRGLLSGDAKHSEDRIERAFYEAMRRHLSRLEVDVGMIS